MTMDKTEMMALADELDGWHDCADGDVSAGNGHFRVVEHMWPTQRSPEPAVSEVVVVPRVPTEAMVKAGQSAIPAGHGQAWIYAADAYSAMLNAATKDGERS